MFKSKENKSVIHVNFQFFQSISVYCTQPYDGHGTTFGDRYYAIKGRKKTLILNIYSLSLPSVTIEFSYHQ